MTEAGAAFFSRPIAAVLGILTIVVWLAPVLSVWRKRTTPSPSKVN